MATKLDCLMIVSSYLLLVEEIHVCSATTITPNTDDSACPGNRLVYTCVSQGTSQRWRISQHGVLLTDTVFRSGEDEGRIKMKNSYTFTLVSATQNQLESTVSVIATISMHNTEVECTGIPLRDSITIKIAGTPSPPVNLQFIVDEYYNHFSTVCLGWDAPNDDSRVDCYQYQLINGTSITIYNTSYTSVTIPGVVYNKNITFLLHSRNCVGTSSPVIETIHIAGCNEFNNTSFNIKNLTSSQAPGTEIMLSCSLNMERDITIACQNDGQWDPNPDNLLCTTDTTMASTRSDDRFSEQTPIDTMNHLKTESPTSIKATTSSNRFLIPIYILASVIFIGLCVVVGLAVVCKVKVMIQKWQAGSTVETNSHRNSDVNREYYEIVDTIYETINTSDDLANFGIQVKMTNNDAYTENIQFCSSTGINQTNNEAYCYVANVVPMKENSSYQATKVLHSSSVARDSNHSEKQCISLDGSGSENRRTSTTTDHEQ